MPQVEQWHEPFGHTAVHPVTVAAAANRLDAYTTSDTTSRAVATRLSNLRMIPSVPHQRVSRAPRDSTLPVTPSSFLGQSVDSLPELLGRPVISPRAHKSGRLASPAQCQPLWPTTPPPARTRVSSVACSVTYVAVLRSSTSRSDSTLQSRASAHKPRRVLKEPPD